jgi:hypothetical protein
MYLRSIRFPDRQVFAGIAAGVLVGVICVSGVGAVTAASPSPGGPSTPAGASSEVGPSARPGLGAAPPSSRLGNGIRLAALRRAVGRNFRVDLTATSADGTRNLLYVRGTLDASPGSITVTLPDHSTATFGVDAATIVRDNGATVASIDVVDGDPAIVVGTRNQDGSYTARLVRLLPGPTEPVTPPVGATP